MNVYHNTWYRLHLVSSKLMYSVETMSLVIIGAETDEKPLVYACNKVILKMKKEK